MVRSLEVCAWAEPSGRPCEADPREVDLRPYSRASLPLHFSCLGMRYRVGFPLWPICEKHANFALLATSRHFPTSAVLPIRNVETYSLLTNAGGTVHFEELGPDISRHYHRFDDAWRNDCLRSERCSNCRRDAAFLHQVSPAVPA